MTNDNSNFCAYSASVKQNFRQKNFEIMPKNFLIFLFQFQSRVSTEAVLYKNGENRRDKKSHTWAPLKVLSSEMNPVEIRLIR
jgi:hypothetical protein